ACPPLGARASERKSQELTRFESRRRETCLPSRNRRPTPHRCVGTPCGSTRRSRRSPCDLRNVVLRSCHERNSQRRNGSRERACLHRRLCSYAGTVTLLHRRSYIDAPTSTAVDALHVRSWNGQST